MMCFNDWGGGGRGGGFNDDEGGLMTLTSMRVFNDFNDCVIGKKKVVSLGGGGV